MAANWTVYVPGSSQARTEYPRNLTPETVRTILVANGFAVTGAEFCVDGDTLTFTAPRGGRKG